VVKRWKRAVVIGAGPNGLAAAIVLAREGLAVEVIEAADTVGGSCRSAELTLPGFVHDVCAAIHPMAAGSPFFRTLPLHEHGLEWVHPEAPLAHPLDDGTAVMLERSPEATAENLGPDAATYLRLMKPLVRDWPSLADDLLAPVRLPRHPVLLAKFGWQALRSAEALARSRFRGERARALFAGLAGHSMLRLDAVASASFGLVLAAAGHAVGWPVVRGGSQKLMDALASYFRSLGGHIQTGRPVDSLDGFSPDTLMLADIAPRELLRIGGPRLPRIYRRVLQHYRHVTAAYKLDYALTAPIPWTAPACRRAATLHLSGSLAETAASERAAWNGRVAERPLVLLAQQSLFDPSRTPAGRHTLWAYCHVPNGCEVPMESRIEAQIERFAPGFRKLVLARSVHGPRALEAYNPNLVGGDINGGAPDIFQFFIRPSLRLYATPLHNLFLCSAATPPGGGVHGMCGYYAAEVALRAA
jgi:phytoene dehydrogenase-like protein